MASTIKVNTLDTQSGTNVTIAAGKNISGANTQYTVTGGAADQVLATDGAGALSWVGLAGFASRTIYTTTPGSNWSRPAGITKVIVECQGGGGGGANHPSTEAQSGGGGGGGYAWKFIDVSSVTEAVITVGVAGAGNSGSAGGNGTETKWLDTSYGGSSTVIGGGGLGSPYSSQSIAGGGVASGGDFHMNGANGYNQKARMAGSSQLGRGGQNLHNSENPGSKSPGTGYGGGGGGVTGAQGSAGSAGIMIVWEFK